MSPSIHISYCPSAMWFHEAHAFLEVLGVWGSEPAATPRGEANSSCAASGVGCQGSGLAISYSLHNKYSMKKPCVYSWAPNKCLPNTHKHASLNDSQSYGWTTGF